LKQRQFLQVVDRDEAERRFREALSPLVDLGSEPVALDAALHRVVAEDVRSELDVPGFDRSNMDGWAVRAEDTYGASEQQPLRLKRASEGVVIGTLPAATLKPGEAMAIPTGGALPRGADAVLQVEATEVVGDSVEVRRAITPGTALSYAGTDIARGETMLRRGDRLSSREIGVLAAIGRGEVSVRVQPRVAVISTGNELSAPGEPLVAGRVHDANASLIAAAVREQGCVPHHCGIIADDDEALRTALTEALANSDVVLLSGGTSKGPGDLSAQVLDKVLDPPGVVVHGVALKPGKPLCLAASGHKPVVVLPGFPTSAIFTFHELVAPLLRDMSGIQQHAVETVSARLPYRFRSDPGRREYTLVHLVTASDGERIAYPIGKGSGSVTTWSHADGYFIVPRHTERVDADAEIIVHAMAGLRPRQQDLVVIGSHCVGLDIIIGALRQRQISCKLVAVGSEAGLDAAKRGACDVAPIHLLHNESGSYNAPFMSESIELIEGYGRMQGVVFRRGDARFEGKDASDAFTAAASDGSAMINRNRGSGTRALYDELLGASRPPGHSIEASSHHAVAAAVQQKRADFGIAIEVVARDRDLGFLPLTEERFDFAVPRGRRQRAALQAFIEVLVDPSVRRSLAEKGFIT
jgi:putative molybdopterin biosynthesis protein